MISPSPAERKNRVRVLQLAPLWETVPPPAYGGTEAVVHCLIQELLKRGVNVTLCASGDSLTDANFFSVFPRSLRAAGLTDRPWQYSLMHAVLSLKEAADGSYDLIHNHNGPPSELGMALSHLVDVPMLTTLHNNLTKEDEFIWSNYRGWYNTISRAQFECLPCLPQARFAGVVHNSIDVDSFPFETQKDDYALFLGRFAPEKAPHLAIEAARLAGIRLVLAGKVGMPEEREYFEALVKPHIDGRDVQFLGEADGATKRELYRRARCVLVPIQWEEPFGLVMIEAMACGTPPIAIARGAAREIIDHGRTGFLVSDVAEMARAIDDVDTIDAFTCRAYVEERFGPAALADRYLDIYKRMLQSEHEGGVALE
jgi:glycosyltransferase involved in cell wall biosynthesis